MEISNSVKYIGVNDHAIDLFEGQYIVENGMAYNSYVILDDKIAVLDTVDADFTQEWLHNLQKQLDSRKPDYLIVQHMEPDHSAGIVDFMEMYKDAVIVASASAFNMMKQFFGKDFADRRMLIKDSDTLSLGEHLLTFVSAPMVHWPEVMVTYESTENILFSADAFGKFGALDVEEDWACEARRYYIGIVGKYGMQVQNLLKKASALTIKTICPLHGPVLNENLDYYIDLAREDMAECVEDAFRYGKLVLATTTYNADIFPFMKEFLHHLMEHNYQNRTVAFIENGSWAPVAAKNMKALLETCKNLTFTQNEVHIKSALNEESMTQLEELACELCVEYHS